MFVAVVLANPQNMASGQQLRGALSSLESSTSTSMSMIGFAADPGT
jgi:hypothetical protein